MKTDLKKEIGKALAQAGTVLIFPHIMVDGDGLGSSVALCRGLRQQGKEAWVVTEDKIAEHLKFLKGDVCVPVRKCKAIPDVSVCVDCNGEDRFPKRADLFRQAAVKICIDHHPTSKEIWDLNDIDPKAAATGELIYDLMVENQIPIDTFSAECLYAAIATDTGNYTYSNTTRHSHAITMDLMGRGVDVGKVARALYENESMEKLKLHSMVIGQVERFADGQAVIASVTQAMLKECSATLEDTEGLVGTLRSLKGVEIAALLKEHGDGEIKVTLRAKEHGDVAKIATEHGGGGHVKAAGCTLRDMTMKQAYATIKKDIERAIGDGSF